MKELQPIEKTQVQDSRNNTPQKTRRTKGTKVITQVNAKSPASSSCAIPILAVLSESPDNGIEAKAVIREVIKWFDRLDDQDVNARYAKSKKKITQTVVKYQKKTLAMKGQVFPADGKTLGIWRITSKGSERVMKEKDTWVPRYTRHTGIVIGEE
jgi:hypothetical protein